VLQTHYQQPLNAPSAHLATTMTLLSLTADELLEKVESELSNNPALELVEERRCPSCKRLLPPTGPCPICSQPTNYQSDQPIVFVSAPEDFYTGSSLEDNDGPEEPFIPETLDLPAMCLSRFLPNCTQKSAPLQLISSVTWMKMDS